MISNHGLPVSMQDARSDTHSTIEDHLREIHKIGGAGQTALYYFAYPRFDQLILFASEGNRPGLVRYWRPHFADAAALEEIRRSEGPIGHLGETVTGGRESTVAFPVMNGKFTIGVVVLCYIENPPGGGAMDEVRQAIRDCEQTLFGGWIDFIVSEQTRPLSILFQIAGAISSSLDLERVLLNVVEQATILFRVKMSSLHLIDWKSRELEMITAYGCSLDYLDKPNLPIDGSLLGKVVLDNKARQIRNLFEEPSYTHKDLARREGVTSLMVAPISFQDQILGVLNIYSAHERHWQRSEMELLQTFANHAAIAISNVRFHEQMLSMEEQLHLTAKRSTLGELAAGLAHEIRNPLAVINMLIHSWKSSSPDPADFAHDVDVVAQKITDLNHLVTDLLNLSTSRPLDRNPHNLEELADRVHRLLRHRMNQQRVHFKKEVLLEDTVISIDRERMEQAILNLLLNALDVTPEGGRIEVAIRPEDDLVAIDVADSGPGIPAENLSDLFKMFRTTKEHGSGLGLSIAKRIVEEHNGEICITRNGGTGATFTLLLPREAE